MNSPLSDSADDSENDCPDEYKDIFTTKNWIFERKFTNSEQAIKYLKSQQLWDIDQKKCCAVVGGYKAMYRCTFVGVAANHCSAAKCIFFPNTSAEVLIFRSDQAHEHDTRENKKIRRTQNLGNGDQDVWTIEQKFDCVDAAKKYLQSQKIWSWKSKNHSECGTKWEYRCNQVSRHGPQCASKMYYIQNQSTGDVLLYHNNSKHTHETIPSKSSQYGSQTMEQSNEDDSQVQSLDASTATGGKLFTQEEESESDQTKFKFQMSFANISDAEKHLRDITIWSKYNYVNARGGLKEYYCCNLEDEAGSQCPAQLYLIHSIKSGKIRLYRNNQQHTHRVVLPTDNLIIEDELITDENDEIILNYDDCEDIIMDEVPTNELIGEEIIIGDFVDENQFAIEVNGDEWMYQKKFPNHQQALKYLENRYMILVNKQEVPLGGYQEYYRCGLVLHSDDPCPVISYIEYFDELTDVLLYKNMLTRHTHDDVLPIASVQPNQKMNYSRTKDTFGRKVNSKTIEKWLSFIAFVPSCDDDKPFCANYTIDHQNQTFQCFITTRRLLKIALESRIVHADFKCTLIWQTHHILIIGTTDMNQTFHSFGVAVGPTKIESDYEFAFRSINIGITKCFGCEFKPEMLISNSKSTIQNAFVQVYGTEQSKLITCSNYMLAEITSSLKTIVPNERIRNEIICDIEKIQMVPSPEIFLEAIILFVKKWGTTQMTFIEYFKAKWIQKNTNWYLGLAHYTPATNEALVLEYHRITNDYNLQHNQNFAILKSFLEHVVDTWSNDYVKKSKIFARKPTIALTLYDEACEWNAMQTQIEIEEIDTDTTYYYVPSEITIISQKKLAKYKSKFHENLAEFFNVQFSFWEMKQIKDEDITCSCPYFFRHYICKHSLGMATALNLYSFPTETLSDNLLVKKEEEDDSEGEVILS